MTGDGLLRNRISPRRELEKNKFTNDSNDNEFHGLKRGISDYRSTSWQNIRIPESQDDMFLSGLLICRSASH